MALPDKVKARLKHSGSTGRGLACMLMRSPKARWHRLRLVIFGVVRCGY
jgi:hypothetical protein